jgi:hypothetical protein
MRSEEQKGASSRKTRDLAQYNFSVLRSYRSDSIPERIARNSARNEEIQSASSAPQAF